MPHHGFGRLALTFEINIISSPSRSMAQPAINKCEIERNFLPEEEAPDDGN